MDNIEIIMSTDFDSMRVKDTHPRLLKGTSLKELMIDNGYKAHEVPGHTIIFWCREDLQITPVVYLLEEMKEKDNG